jgi:RNase P/RNase MRP subunit p29
MKAAANRPLLTGDALMPLGLVGTLVVFIAAGLRYVYGIEHRVDTQEKATLELKQESGQIGEIKQKVSRIEGKLDVLLDLSSRRRSDK